MEAISQVRGIGKAVCQAVVNRTQPSGGGITQVAHLHGSGSAGKNLESIARRMPGKLDGDIDFISANLLGGLLVCQRENLPPLVSQRRSAP